MLFGRDSECAALERLLTRCRHRGSGALLVRGEPGTGKTALLQYAAASAGSITVVTASGVESESELPYATLHQLLRPLLGHLPRLPEVQRAALEGALGLAASQGVDRLVLGAGLLTLLGEAAHHGGLLCIIDDLHWVDQASVDALLFAVRRLTGEGVAVVFGARPSSRDTELYSGVEILDLGGLSEDAAAELITERSGTAPARPVIQRLTELTRGHPLSLAELARLLSAEQLQGRSALPDPLPLTADLQRPFLERVRQLSPAAQLALVVAAVDSTSRLSTLLQAMHSLGLDDEAVVEAEESGLLSIGPHQSVTFVHPLARTAVASGAGPSQRRTAHRALAGVLTDSDDTDRGIWHAAAAVIGVDDMVAEQLEAAARSSMSRGAPAAAAAALQRAAELTSDARVGARRYVAAGRAAWLAGQADLAYSALDLASSQWSDRLLLAEVAELRGLLQWRQGDAAQAHAILVRAAPTVAEDHPAMALRMLVHATEAASWYGDVAELVAAGRLAQGITVDANADQGMYQNYAVGLAAALTGDSATAGQRLARVIAAVQQSREPECLVWAAKAAMFLGRLHDASGFAQLATSAARSSGATALLVQSLEMLALLEHAQGRSEAAHLAATEGLDLAVLTGHTSSAALFWATLSTLAAERGNETACREAAQQAWKLARPRRLGLAAAVATHAVAQLEMMKGDYASALQRLTELATAGPGEASPSVSMLTLPDLIETAVRLDRSADARDAMARLEGWADASGSSLTRSMMLRCRALLDPDNGAASFAAAIAAHPAGEAPLQLARTTLLYGQLLRRARRQSEARDHLRAALLIFEKLGCQPLAGTARDELRAAGGTAGRAELPQIDLLTGQERTIAWLVSQGSSTKDVAARLFLSPRTVEYHLHKIYPKLGIRSRTELAHAFAQPGKRSS